MPTPIMDANDAESQPLLGRNDHVNTPLTGHRYTEAEVDAPSPAPASPSDCDFDFDPLGDVDNPLEWPIAFKWGIVTLLALMAFTVTLTCIAAIPLAPEITADLSPSGTPPSKSASILLVTIWELGEAAGPLLIAPLSEMFGRYPVLNAANLLFIFATALAATAQSLPVFVSARALTGLAVATNVLNPAIVGDMFGPDERGAAVSLIFLAPLLGGAFGPAIASAVAARWGWRSVVWASVGLASGCGVLLCVLLRETYRVVILRKRREGRRRSVLGAGDDGKGLQAVAVEVEKRGMKELRDAVLRPGIVLFGSGVLMAMSLFGSVVFTYFYVMNVTLPDILREIYQLEPVAAGMCFISFSVGSVFSVFVCNRNLDKIYIRMRESHKGVGQPEFRLPIAIVGALTMPVATATYGWVAELALPLPFLLCSLAFLGCTLMLALIPLMAYVVDAFGMWSASAMTGVIVTRCLVSTFLPLATAPLVDNYGYGWAFTVFAVLCLVLAPIPILVMRYGPHWRQLSKYSRD
ncbi:major facilitator superfamily domain-containing protein [Podospora conica]|nr:major facilitator superfamily domain-containing protein [Schizothecium conicum]